MRASLEFGSSRAQKKRPAIKQGVNPEMLSPGGLTTNCTSYRQEVNPVFMDFSDGTTRKRTICYVDGFNLYFGIVEAGLRDRLWLNIRDMAAKMVRLPHVLAGTKYFTARVSGARPTDSPTKAAERESARLRQVCYLEALETLRGLEILEGHFLLKRDHCRLCKSDFFRPEEKMTDVRIATEVITDAFLNRFDTALIVSADGDLVPPITAIREHFPQKRIVVAFPPNRYSRELTEVAHHVFNVWPRTLERSQLPLQVVKRDGTVLNKPAEWN